MAEESVVERIGDVSVYWLAIALALTESALIGLSWRNILRVATREVCGVRKVGSACKSPFFAHRTEFAPTRRGGSN
jgi:hypothetical protein